MSLIAIRDVVIILQDGGSSLSRSVPNLESTFSENQDETDIISAARSILEESQQIAELTEMEKVYLARAVSRFGEITSVLKESYHVRPESIAKNDSSVTDVVLTANGVILVFHGNKLVTSTPLELIKGDDLVRILQETIPKAELLLRERRQKISQRVTMLEKAIFEAKKVASSGSKQELRGKSRNLE